MDAGTDEASPVKAVIEELEILRADFRASLETYASRIESEISQIEQVTSDLQKRKKIPSSKLRDLRDMLTLLRRFQIKPEKGRRKDLKKIDSLIGDLSVLIEHW